ncbi:bridge-like lipid transfer protein family member hobbit isoform X2 [Rhynchophorus ferrugineus]|uniref:bridge-like lipid transfer protein family member hobbit isoform X2 n=1 Tax=Rhynchophorus ferrugineus TaxID=354439 RepID=UPI003FCD1CAF
MKYIILINSCGQEYITIITMSITLILTVVLILFVSISRAVPFILSWFFEKKYNIPIKIGKIGLPYLKLCDIIISKNEYMIQIDEIGIKSSFLNSELTKLITLVVKCVRIKKTLTRKPKNNETVKKEVLDFRQKTIPNFINSFAQFMAVHIYDFSAILMQEENECLVQTTAKELHIDGSILKNAKSLLVTFNTTDTLIKVFKNNNELSPRLAEFSFNIAMETVLVAQGPLSVERLDIKVPCSRATISNGFFSVLHNPKNKAHYSSDLKTPNKYELHVTKNDNGDVLERVLPIVPKNCSIKIENTSLQGELSNGTINCASSIKTMGLIYHTISQNDSNKTLFNFFLKHFDLKHDLNKTIQLKHLIVDAKLKNKIINIYLQQQNLLITYDHSVLFKWLSENIPQRTNLNNIEQSSNIDCTSVYLTKKRYSMVEEIIKDISLNFCAEISNVMAIIKLHQQSSSTFAINKVRLMLDQVQESRGSQYESYFANLLFSDRHWQVELLIESLWWSFKEWDENTISKVMHLWGTPFYLGMGLIKFCTSENEDFKLYSILDTVHLEWSLKLADFALLALRSLLSYKFRIKNILNKKRSVNKKKFNFTTSIVMTHFNCFLQSQNNEYFVSRLDAITIETNPQLSSFKFEEFKVFTLNNTGDYYTCIRTEDILNYKIFIKMVQLDYIKKNGSVEYDVTFWDDNIAYWSANFHLKALLLLRDITDFQKQVLNIISIHNAPPKKEIDSLKIIKCRVLGKFEFYIDISKNHSAKVVLDDVSLCELKHNADEERSVNHIINTITIAIDNSDIFDIRGLTYKRLFEDEAAAEKIKAERIEAGCPDNYNKNRTYLIQIDVFKVVFPHEHNYAEAVQNQFLSVVKWLKMVHKNPNATSIKPPILQDWLIKIQECIFEMSDDPFEVKLRDNFELLVDEYNESLKRHKMLKEKISELLKVHLHMHTGKVEDLYAILKKKNADIYVQRSKLMYQAAPQRTTLFAWTMIDVELMVLMRPEHLDIPNIHTIRKMDPDSPWPEENMNFSTFWTRLISLRCEEWKFQLRDFPQPLLDIKKMYLCGELTCAEQLAPSRAIRTVLIDLGDPFEPCEISRSMQPRKFYYDLNCEIESYSYAFGPCWEPVIAQCNLSFNKIFAPSRDPSPPLPFWDKMRLLMHGRLTMVVQKLQVLLHASLDPYNTTEEMALTWEKVIMDWTNAKLVFKGDLNIFVRTASKYDDVQLLKLPNLKLILNFQWVCLGDPNDHHNVIYCAPDKIPEYSSNQVHDSFRAFRSQNVNLSIVLETKPTPNQSQSGCPILLLYGSTLRWIENLKLILSGVTRPTKRGRIFNNLRPRKIQLSRHYKKLNLLVGLHKFQVCYWMSFSMHRGCELFGGRLSSSSEHSLSLISIDDGLKHRPKAEWSIVYMNSELTDSEIWLKSALQDDSEIETSRLQPIEKTYCLSVAKVSYGREATLPTQSNGNTNKETPTHRLVVYDLRGAWTKSNRNVALVLFDTFMKTKRMKKNLSTEALKGFRKDTNTTPMKRRNAESSNTPANTAMQAIQASSSSQDTPSPICKLQSGHAANMLQQLIAEADNNSIVYSDDLSAVSRQQYLQGAQACQGDDVIHKNWQISLVNAQVLLKGCETNGYVILSAAKAEIMQRNHRPVWKDRTLVSKTTWTGLLECMQYYATVNAGENDPNENIMWLTVDNIQEKESAEISEPSEVPNMVGSGVSVGAVVSDTVGPSTSRQLQRIVSRCKCEFYYAGYGDISVDPEGIGEIPPPPQEDVSPWDNRQIAVDAFTLMHYDLNVCTNSLQYAMLLDIINNLLLYVEPHRKEALEKLARMRLQLLLHSFEDQRRPIQEKQTIVRNIINKLRRLEKDAYLVNKAFEDNPDDVGLKQELDRLDRQMHDCKINLNTQSEELDMMLSCYKETQLLANAKMATTRKDKPLTVVRSNEICFKHAQWRLTEADGQIGIADLVLSNFLYTKNSKSDDSVEHLLELGYLRMTNLLPNEIYKEILCPTEIQYDMPIEHKKVLRIFCREKPPVGGISVKEHFEINLVPLTIGLTKKFYNTMMKFSFPERDTEAAEFNDRASEDGDDREVKAKKGKSKKSRDSNFYVHIDDVEKMKVVVSN